MVLQALKTAKGELSLGGLQVSLEGKLSRTQIQNLLSHLRQHGLVSSPTSAGDSWRLTDVGKTAAIHATHLPAETVSNADRVLAVFEQPGVDLRLDGIYEALGGQLSREQVTNALKRLGKLGVLRSPGRGTKGAWQLVVRADADAASADPEPSLATVAATPVEVPQDPPPAPPPVPAPTQLQRLVQQASTATASALQAIAAEPWPSQALLKIAAANSLRAEPSALVHQERGP